MEFVSVFDEAGRDYDAEQAEIRHTAASVEAQQVWPFLALAQSEEEFEHRLALAQVRLEHIATKHQVDIEEVVEPLRRGFRVAHQVEAAGLECKRCGHSNVPHVKGAICTCGCTTFAPKTAAKDDWSDAQAAEAQAYCSSCAPSYTRVKEPTADEPCKNCGGVGWGGKKSSKTAGTLDTEGPGPSYDPNSIGELFLNGTKSNPVWFYNEGYEHGKSGATYRGYGGRDAAILYGHGYRHGSQDRSVPDPEALPKESKVAGYESAEPGNDGRCKHGKMWGDRLDTMEVRGTETVKTPYPKCPQCRKEWEAKGKPSGPDWQKKTSSWEEHIANLHQALMEGEDPLSWIQDVGGEGNPPSHHDDTEQFEGTNRDARDQALDQAGTSAPPSEHKSTQAAKEGGNPF